jgi:hypothetical protein
LWILQKNTSKPSLSSHPGDQKFMAVQGVDIIGRWPVAYSRLCIILLIVLMSCLRPWSTSRTWTTSWLASWCVGVSTVSASATPSSGISSKRL